MCQNALQKDWLSSRSWLQREFIWSKYDSFYCIFSTADLFATRLDLMYIIIKWSVLLKTKTKKTDCCIQVQGHSENSKWMFVCMICCEPLKLTDCCIQVQGHSKNSKWMFVWMICCEPLKFLLPNLVWGCNIMNQSVMLGDWFLIFMVKVTVKAYIIQYDCFYHIYWTADPFVTTPEGRPGMSDVSPCLVSQGCHLIPLCYRLSCSSA